MKIYQYDIRVGNKIETAVVVPFASESRIEGIANNLLVNAEEVIMTVWQNGEKLDTKSFTKEVELAEVVIIEEKPKMKKSDVFFKVNEKYTVLMRSTGNREFEVTEIDLKNDYVYGKYANGDIKKYKAELNLHWKTNLPDSYSIIVDNRTKFKVSSKNLIK